MADTAVLGFDREVIGVENEMGSFEVTKEAIQNFCKAIGETNPLFTDEDAAKSGPYGSIVAPPTFYAVARIQGGGRNLDPKVTLGGTPIGELKDYRGFNAGQHCTFYMPMKPGDTITAKNQVADVYEKTGRTGRMVFVVRRTTYYNQHGEKVAAVDQSMVNRQVEARE
jgi:acyl dehydratase